MHFHHPDSLCAQLVTSLSDSKAAYQNPHWDTCTIECKHFQTNKTYSSYVNLIFIQNKTGQRKQTQLVMVICDSHLQFDKTKMRIEADLRKFICNPDKPHICWSNHNTEHKWPKKADAATVTRPYFPTTVWQDQNQHSDRIAWAYFQSRQDALMLILA